MHTSLNSISSSARCDIVIDLRKNLLGHRSGFTKDIAGEVPICAAIRQHSSGSKVCGLIKQLLAAKLDHDNQSSI